MSGSTAQFVTSVEIKAVDTAQRLITGHAAAIGNKDRVGDVIDTGAFDRTLKENDDVLVFIGHDSSRLTVGEPVSIRPDTKGLLTQTRVYNTPAGDELLEVAKQRMASGKTLGMSIGYRTVKSRNSGGARHLLDVDLVEYSFLASPALAANPEATVTGVKRHKATGSGPVITTDDSYEELREDLATAAAIRLGRSYVSVCCTFSDHVIVAGYMDDDTHYWDIPYTLDADGEPELGEPSEVDPAFVPASAKARAIPPEEKPVKVWTAEMKAALPDSAFAFVEPGGVLDMERKTVPRTARHFAHHGADGLVDMDLLSAALQDAETSEHGPKVIAHLKRHAVKAGLPLFAVDGPDDAHTPEWTAGVAPQLLTLTVKMAGLAERAAADRQAMERLGLPTNGGERVNSALMTELKAARDHLTRMIDQAESIDRGEDGKLRVDLFRHRLAMLELEEVS